MVPSKSAGSSKVGRSRAAFTSRSMPTLVLPCAAASWNREPRVSGASACEAGGTVAGVGVAAWADGGWGGRSAGADAIPAASRGRR